MPAPKRSKAVFMKKEMEAATAHFQGLQEEEPLAWKSHDKADRWEKAQVRQIVRDKRREKKLADWLDQPYLRLMSASEAD